MFVDPTRDLNCYKTCPGCFKCADYGTKSMCYSCPAKPDPQRRAYPDPDSYCDCRNGILRHRTQEGKLLVAKIPGNPYQGRVLREKETADERDYENYVKMMKERTGDAHWSALRFEGGQSTDEWYDAHKRGRPLD